jgi:hypothetical protein
MKPIAFMVAAIFMSACAPDYPECGYEPLFDPADCLEYKTKQKLECGGMRIGMFNSMECESREIKYCVKNAPGPYASCVAHVESRKAEERVRG